MLEAINGVKNEAPFYYFEQISKIPRASGNEHDVAQYIYNFAIRLGLEAYMDEYSNVLVKKPASIGRESDAPVMLQAHTDMVAEKNVSTDHDFSKDPIVLVQNGNILRANGTTLGADDGFGVSIMMAILADNSISAPAIECLFTSSEEIGLVGASKFDYSRVTARQMINLDSAEEDTVIIGCCGGIRTEFTLPFTKVNGDFKGYRLTIGGLCGGHSGEDIDRNRLNAHILMGKLLTLANDNTPISLSHISGGDKDNAIPRECEAVFVCDNEINVDFETYARSFLKAKEDDGLFVKVERINVNNHISSDDTAKVLKLLSIRNGVLYYRTVEPILPETSRNLARIRTNENDFSIGFSSRSYLEERLNESTNELDALAKELGGSTYHHEKYPGWASDKGSKLVVAWQNAFEKTAGKRPYATLIHAGLECGLISAELPGLVAISVGCNVHDLHTPKETMELDSMDRIYEALIEALK